MILQMLTAMKVYWNALELQREEGQDFVEYGLVIVLIALFIAASVTLGQDVLDVFTEVATKLSGT